MKLKNKITGGMLCIFMLAVFLGGYSLFAVLRLSGVDVVAARRVLCH